MDCLAVLDQFLKENQIAFSAEVPMKDYTTFKIGGNCRRMVWPSSGCEIRKLLTFCREKQLPLYLVGNGSNLLVADGGLDGIVLQLGSRFSGIFLEGETQVVCESGATLARACVFAKDHGLTGMEFAYGIPGSVGGAAYMNAGAYGGEMKDIIAWCEHVDPEGNIVRVAGEELSFSYRSSIYTDGENCITRVCFDLKPGNREEISAAMEDYMERRRSKQPLEFPSAGSTFKRPKGGYASALIDQCGLKGYSCGGAKVSEKHAGFIINYKNATCEDVLRLIGEVSHKVEEETGFVLEPEVKLLP